MVTSIPQKCSHLVRSSVLSRVDTDTSYHSCEISALFSVNRPSICSSHFSSNDSENYLSAFSPRIFLIILLVSVLRRFNFPGYILKRRLHEFFINIFGYLGTSCICFYSQVFLFITNFVYFQCLKFCHEYAFSHVIIVFFYALKLNFYSSFIFALRK